MTTRLIASVVLLTIVAAPLGAQTRTEAAAWQSLAATLRPGTFVEVRLKDGAHFKGTLMQQSPDGIVVKPHTRVPVPARDIGFADLESIEVAKKGISPGMKVLIGVGVSVGAVALLGFLALANSY